MRLGALGTKVARRIIMLFTLGAMVPVVTLSALSLRQMSGELRDQSERRLDQLTDIMVQSIFERLAMYSTLLSGSVVPAQGERGVVRTDPFSSVGLGSADTDAEAEAPGGVLTQAERDQLANGRSILRPGDYRATGTATLLVPGPGTEPGSFVWGALPLDSVWILGVARATSDYELTGLCILDHIRDPIFCADGLALNDLSDPHVRGAQGTAGILTLQDRREILAWREVYLRSTYGADPWMVLVSQGIASAYAVPDRFAYNLAISLLIAVSTVLLLTHVMIRRTLEPLEALTLGTREISADDLDVRVPVRSGDEFGELAISFNRMAERLGAQFTQLEARQSIDRAVVSSSDAEDALTALVSGIARGAPNRRFALLMLPGAQDPEPTLVVHDGMRPESVRLDERQASTISIGDEVLRVERPEEIPTGLAPLAEVLPGSSLIIPLKASGRSFGVLAASTGTGLPFDRDEAGRLQAIAEHAAVALAKIRLDEEVSAISWEALRALANTIDAKSRWTAGHSERVTDLSLRMGDHMGLEHDSMEILRRGGLLHDIGKIAVPASILDSPGKLTDDMRATIQEHPAAGARILEPVRAFTPLIPIVLYHHERWDGKGYPEGLAGTEIPFLARLVAVADVFDAMVSARPYRPKGDPEKVWEHIRDLAGEHFDPEMVDVFDGVMSSGWRPTDSKDADAGITLTLGGSVGAAR